MPDTGLRGIGGWLFLVAAGVLVSPFLLAYALIQTIDIAGKVESAPMWGHVVVWGELIIYAGLLVASVVVAFIFLSKKRSFPAVASAVLAANAIFTMLELAVGAAMSSSVTMEEGRQVFWSGISAIIWITYLQRSKRVRATFVN